MWMISFMTSTIVCPISILTSFKICTTWKKELHNFKEQPVLGQLYVVFIESQVWAQVFPLNVTVCDFYERFDYNIDSPVLQMTPKKVCITFVSHLVTLEKLHDLKPLSQLTANCLSEFQLNWMESEVHYLAWKMSARRRWALCVFWLKIEMHRHSVQMNIVLSIFCEVFSLLKGLPSKEFSIASNPFVRTNSSIAWQSWWKWKEQIWNSLTLSDLFNYAIKRRTKPKKRIKLPDGLPTDSDIVSIEFLKEFFVLIFFHGHWYTPNMYA